MGVDLGEVLLQHQALLQQRVVVAVQRLGQLVGILRHPLAVAAAGADRLQPQRPLGQPGAAGAHGVGTAEHRAAIEHHVAHPLGEGRVPALGHGGGPLHQRMGDGLAGDEGVLDVAAEQVQRAVHAGPLEHRRPHQGLRRHPVEPPRRMRERIVGAAELQALHFGQPGGQGQVAAHLVRRGVVVHRPGDHQPVVRGIDHAMPSFCPGTHHCCTGVWHSTLDSRAGQEFYGIDEAAGGGNAVATASLTLHRRRRGRLQNARRIAVDRADRSSRTAIIELSFSGFSMT
ncbi:hypothetical protein D3C76_881140 [compost metagenome]